MLGRWSGIGVVALALGCQTVVIVDEEESDTESGSGPEDTPPTLTLTSTSPSTSTAPTDSTGDTTASVDESTSSTTGNPVACAGDNCAVDILFVIDNSGTMAIEQANIARAMLLLEPLLQELELDVQVMFTTTDNSNPLCSPFKPDGYTPAAGAPIGTACANRLEDFTGLGSNPDVVPEACTDLCPVSVAPADPFIAFAGSSHNVPGASPTDVDGDGVDDSEVAQAMACVAPMGINGCGYESPLETMLRALDPAAAWNGGALPFLRPESDVVAIVVVTDEADCSIDDFDVMTDETYQETDPDDLSPAASSAICWNAGVTCAGPDAMGVYSDCVSMSPTPLQPVDRYTNYLIDQLRENQGKEVVMLGVVGIPPVTAHEPDPPFTPTAGGVFDLVYRNWLDGEFPVGDILPAEFAAGVTAADKQFDFGIGPGCTGGDAVSGFTGQAIPPVRLREVCESLDLDRGADATDRRCCLESICDDDYAPAMSCLAGLLQNVTG